MRLQTSYFNGYAIAEKTAGSAYGIKIADWNNANTGSAGTWALETTDLPENTTNTCKLTYNATPSSYTVSANSIGVLTGAPLNVGIWLKYNGSVTRNFQILLTGTAGRNLNIVTGVQPSADWQFIICQEQQYYGSSPLLAGDSITTVQCKMFQTVISAQTWQPWEAGETIKFGAVYINSRTRPKFIIRTDDGFDSNVANGAGYPAGYPTSGGNYNDIFTYYGFVGTALITPSLVGTSGYLTLAQLQTMATAGWSFCNHSYSHPYNSTSHGLGLLGPYGYWYSQLVTQGYLTTEADRQVITCVAATNVLTTKADHKFNTGTPYVFVDWGGGDVIPGVTLGTTYWIKTTPSATTFTLAPDATLATTVDITGDVTATGNANYRYYGSSVDDSAIYDDIMLAKQTLDGYGLTNMHSDWLAIPQGGWDPYVMSAIQRAGFYSWNTCNPATGQIALPVGKIAGGGNSGSTWHMNGWIEIPGSIQCDGSPTITQIKAFVDQCVRVGGTGAAHVHGISAAVATTYDALCAYLQLKQRQGLIDVVTLTEWINGK